MIFSTVILQYKRYLSNYLSLYKYAYIGADIMMQLDDVVSSVNQNDERFTEATYRSVRWLDRCITAHKNPGECLLICLLICLFYYYVYCYICCITLLLLFNHVLSLYYNGG